MRYQSLLASILISGVLVAHSASAQKYEFDVVHSHIGFTVRHMVVANVSGRFKDFSGTILYDENDIGKSSVQVTIQTSSIDTENEKRDGHLRSADFFDVANHPEIKFVSTKVESRGEGYVAIGDLTMRGVTKPVELPFKILGKVNDDWGNTRVGFEATSSLNRMDYGVKWDKKMDTGGLVVGEQVQLNLAVEAVSAKPKSD